MYWILFSLNMILMVTDNVPVGCKMLCDSVLYETMPRESGIACM